eukprot:1141326-Pelagomonas_calceolata.AAC.1
MYLDLPHHVLRNTAKFRLRVHTLQIEQSNWSNITSRFYKGFTMVAYSPRLWLMAAGETSSTSIKN